MKKKFEIRVSDRLLWDEEDAKTCRQAKKEMEELEAKYPATRKKCAESKEAVWVASEALRKGTILNYSMSELQGLRANLWRAQAGVIVPLKELNAETKKL